MNLITLATKIMLGKPYDKPEKSVFDLDYVGVKASQFSFSRLQKADPVLGVDMMSTGEVGCISYSPSEALLESMLAVGQKIPERGVLMSTGGAKQKVDLLEPARLLIKRGLKIYATEGTCRFLNENGVPAELCHWPSEEGKEPQALDLVRDHKVDLVVNVNKNLTPRELTNGYKLRRAAIDHNISLVTNARLAASFIEAFCAKDVDDIEIMSWDEFK